MDNNPSRRKVLKQMAAGSLAIATGTLHSFASIDTDDSMRKLKGNINHSVCQWTYNFLPLEELCKVVKKIGFGAIDLIAPKDWPILKKHGIFSSMCYSAGKISLTEGWNNKDFHQGLIKDFTEVQSKEKYITVTVLGIKSFYKSENERHVKSLQD